MKLFIASILLVFCFGLQSCRDDDYTQELPPNTQHQFPHALSEFYKLNWEKPTNFDVFDAKTNQMLFTENWIYKESDTLIRDQLYSVVEKYRNNSSKPYETLLMWLYLRGLYFQAIGNHNMPIMILDYAVADSAHFYSKEVPGRPWLVYGYYSPLTTVEIDGVVHDSTIHSRIDSLAYNVVNLPNFSSKQTHLYFVYGKGLSRLDEYYFNHTVTNQALGTTVTDTTSHRIWIRRN